MRRKPGRLVSQGESSARGVEASDEHVKVVDEHARMCLASRPERLFDAKVQFDAMTAKARAAPAYEDRRLADLSHAEHASVERPRSVLVASGHRQLHVMQAVQHTGKPHASRPTALLLDVPQRDPLRERRCVPVDVRLVLWVVSSVLVRLRRRAGVCGPTGGSLSGTGVAPHGERTR